MKLKHFDFPAGNCFFVSVHQYLVMTSISLVVCATLACKTGGGNENPDMDSEGSSSSSNNDESGENDGDDTTSDSDSDSESSDTSGETSTTGDSESNSTDDTAEDSTGDATGDESESGEESSTGDPEPTTDELLAMVLSMQKIPVVPLEPAPAQEPALVKLGEALFFDPILSGNKDTACASCHHPSFASSDQLSLTLGTGATGVGPERIENEHPEFVPRHSQVLYNLGYDSFTRMFWDGRVEKMPDGTLRTPAGDDLLPGVNSALAAQAMFPILDRKEMRGQKGDKTVLDEVNELAEFADDEYQNIWAAIMDRLRAIEGYQTLMSAAFPDKKIEDLTFADAANAIAAYESEAFALIESPWDDYLRGDLDAIPEAAKIGAVFFYGDSGCGNCHTGALLTDHEFHNTGIPQIGPGQADSAPFDYGRERVTGDPKDRFSFRTPSLRNVELSFPYMHNGSLVSFNEVVKHYSSPKDTVGKLDPMLLHEELQDTWQDDPKHVEELVSLLSEDLVTEENFVGLSNIRQFMLTLTDPKAKDLANIRPDSVPSGLPVP